jgi:uncharacterized protein with von Willebrand factor type A (vWA) domain
MLFWEFFNHLRSLKIPTSTNEFIEFMHALDSGLISNFEDLYFICRALLIKDEKFYDLYDKAFLEFFSNQNIENSMKNNIENMSNNLNLNDLLFFTQKQDGSPQEKFEKREKIQQMVNEILQNIIG